MRYFRKTYKKSIRGLSLILFVLFGLHALSIHGLVESLVYCVEENGQINIESEAGSIFTIPSEDIMHAGDQHDHKQPTFDPATDSHHDISLSLICSKEQRVIRFDQERTLRFLDGVLKLNIEDLPQSRAFQFVSFIPPLIEDGITTSLKTVVLIN